MEHFPAEASQNPSVPSLEDPIENSPNNNTPGIWWLAFAMTLLSPAVGGSYATGSFFSGLRYLVWSYVPFLLFVVYAFNSSFTILLLILLSTVLFHIALAGKANMEARESRKRSNMGGKMLGSLGISLLLNQLVLNVLPIEMFKIPSSSMLPNFEVGDRIVVNRWTYGLWNPLTRNKQRMGKPPRRGEVIVFLYPPDPQRVFIKRVIGIPGDSITLRNNQLILNGKLVPTRSHPQPITYTEHADKQSFSTTTTLQQYTEHLGALSFLVLKDPGTPSAYSSWSSAREAKLGTRPWGPKVPKGHVFVMGDNRDYSSDSREWGLVKQTSIIGRVESIFLSLGPNNTIRWGRTGMMVHSEAKP